MTENAKAERYHEIWKEIVSLVDEMHSLHPIDNLTGEKIREHSLSANRWKITITDKWES